MNILSVDDKPPTEADTIEIQEGNCMKCCGKYDQNIPVMFVRTGEGDFRWWHYQPETKKNSACPERVMM